MWDFSGRVISSSQRPLSEYSKTNTRDEYHVFSKIFFCFTVMYLYFFVLALPFIVQHTHTQHKHPCPRRDSNAQPQQAIRQRFEPEAADLQLRPHNHCHDPDHVNSDCFLYVKQSISQEMFKNLCNHLTNFQRISLKKVVYNNRLLPTTW